MSRDPELEPPGLAEPTEHDRPLPPWARRITGPELARRLLAGEPVTLGPGLTPADITRDNLVELYLAGMVAPTGRAGQEWARRVTAPSDDDVVDLTDTPEEHPMPTDPRTHLEGSSGAARRAAERADLAGHERELDRVIAHDRREHAEHPDPGPTADYAGPDELVPIGDVERLIMAVESELDRVAHQAARLETRIDTVLRPPDDTPGEPDANPLRSALARQLEAMRRRTSNLADALADLHDRVDL